MSVKEIQEGGEVWQPKYIKLEPTEETQSAIKSARSRLGLTVTAIVNDRDYKGPVRKILSTMCDPGGGGYPDSFLSMDMLGADGDTIVQFYRNEVYIYDPSVTKVEIADLAESFERLVRQLGLHNTVNGIYGAATESMLEEQPIRFPKDQILRRRDGSFVRNQNGNIVVLYRIFEYRS